MTMFGVRPSMVNYNPPRKVLVRVAGAEGILLDSCAKFKITMPALTGRCRKKEFVAARRYAVRRLIDECGLSSPTIGRLLKRDHSTILHLYKTWETPVEGLS